MTKQEYKYRIRQQNLFSYYVEKAYMCQDGSLLSYEYVDWCLTYAGARWRIHREKHPKKQKIVWEG